MGGGIQYSPSYFSSPLLLKLLLFLKGIVHSELKTCLHLLTLMSFHPNPTLFSI